MRDDAALVAQAKRGETESFSELFRRHAPAVRLAVRDAVPDPEEQIDLVQETFARALQKLGSLEQPARFRSWLLQIARHAAIDHRRRAATHQHVSLDKREGEPLLSADPSPADLLQSRELAHQVRNGFARLSRRDATALALVAHFGFGPAELAPALGVSRATARVVLHRARRRLREAAELEPAIGRAR